MREWQVRKCSEYQKDGRWSQANEEALELQLGWMKYADLIEELCRFSPPQFQYPEAELAIMANQIWTRIRMPD